MVPTGLETKPIWQRDSREHSHWQLQDSFDIHVIRHSFQTPRNQRSRSKAGASRLVHSENRADSLNLAAELTCVVKTYLHNCPNMNDLNTGKWFIELNWLLLIEWSLKCERSLPPHPPHWVSVIVGNLPWCWGAEPAPYVGHKSPPQNDGGNIIQWASWCYDSGF